MRISPGMPNQLSASNISHPRFSGSPPPSLPHCGPEGQAREARKDRNEKMDAVDFKVTSQSIPSGQGGDLSCPSTWPMACLHSLSLLLHLGGAMIVAEELMVLQRCSVAGTYRQNMRNPSLGFEDTAEPWHVLARHHSQQNATITHATNRTRHARAHTHT